MFTPPGDLGVGPSPARIKLCTMNAPDSTASSDSGLEEVRGILSHTTQTLLGDTIAVTDEDWRAPSLLTGWTRGHVATHVARQAEALGRLVEAARTGEPREMYASDDQRNSDIEAGAGRSGLDLQIDLDTTAGQLTEAFESLDESRRWDETVMLRGGQSTKARLLPVARLTEVVLHHIDLDIGFAVGDLDNGAAEWILDWCVFRLGTKDGFPALHLTAESGYSATLGEGEPRAEVSGTSSALLGWLTGRAEASTVAGADGIDLPPL